MSLDNIQLPTFIMIDLFKNSLVDLNSDENSGQAYNMGQFDFLGGNQQKIAILLNNPHETYLSNQSLSFVSGILTACKLTLADVAIFNLYKKSAINYQAIHQILKPRIMFLFGIEFSDIQLPFEVPMFQLQEFSGCDYLHLPSLTKLEADTVLKKQLWVKLQQIFSLK